MIFEFDNLTLNIDSAVFFANLGLDFRLLQWIGAYVDLKYWQCFSKTSYWFLSLRTLLLTPSKTFQFHEKKIDRYQLSKQLGQIFALESLDDENVIRQK